MPAPGVLPEADFAVTTCPCRKRIEVHSRLRARIQGPGICPAPGPFLMRSRVHQNQPLSSRLRSTSSMAHSIWAAWPRVRVAVRSVCSGRTDTVSRLAAD